eukprot:2605847-Rhodomonas_salina.1
MEALGPLHPEPTAALLCASLNHLLARLSSSSSSSLPTERLAEGSSAAMEANAEFALLQSC